MNQDWQEKEIRQLFRNERQANESLTPDFAITVEAALSRRQQERPRRLILRLAFALVALVALVAVAGVVFLVAGRYWRAQDPSVVAGPSESVASSELPMISGLPASVTEPSKPVRRAHENRQSSRRAAPLISQWRSPTEFLLKTPGDEVLRTVPRLGSSAIEIKINLSSIKN